MALLDSADMTDTGLAMCRICGFTSRGQYCAHIATRRPAITR